ncbi:unnamed protein product [Somion occarium]|uniref:Uncharacterized protein n=1 Tax=Somion occarium TaxID=3059160 RepID=A0ABP1E3E6_9APHY
MSSLRGVDRGRSPRGGRGGGRGGGGIGRGNNCGGNRGGNRGGSRVGLGHVDPRESNDHSASNAPSHSTLSKRKNKRLLATEDLLPGDIHIFTRPTEYIGGVIVLENLQYIGSYNWVNENKPAILVPGSPPEWKDNRLPIKLAPDRGKVYVDQNAHRLPAMPLLPLFKAVDAVQHNTAINWKAVAFVTDRNGLRKLADWADGGRKYGEFRIDMQLTGDRTVLLQRWEPSAVVQASRGSYGHNFEKISTTAYPGCEESKSHHRIVKYDLSGLTLIVRFEVDACLPTGPSEGSGVADDLARQLSSLSVASNDPVSQGTSASRGTNSSVIRVVGGGRIVSHADIVELKTGTNPNVKIAKYRDQLLIGQTPHLFLAIHNKGNVREIRKTQLAPAEMNGLAGLQRKFGKLRALLQSIQEFVITQGSGARLSLICKGGKLEVQRRKSQHSALPDDILARFVL